MIIMARYDPIVSVAIAFSVTLVLFGSSPRLPACLLASPCLRRRLGPSAAFGSAAACPIPIGFVRVIFGGGVGARSALSWRLLYLWAVGALEARLLPESHGAVPNPCEGVAHRFCPRT